MIATWMLYASAVTACFYVAAAALEKSVRYAGRPGRWIIASAMLVSVLVPIWAHSAPTAFESGLAERVLPSASDLLVPFVGVLPDETTVSNLNLPLIVCWTALSSMLLAIVALTHVRLATKMKRYPAERVGEATVLRSPILGPAVVGWIRARIVLPRWADHVSWQWRELMVLHEQEHLRGKDAPLLSSAVLLVVLMPWNLPMWFLLVCLRRAIELDCDQRVLGTGVDIRQYGNLLIEVSRRRSRSPIPVIGLAFNRSFLSQRVDAMIQHNKPLRNPKTLAAIALGGAFVIIACELPAPVEPEPAAYTVPQELAEVARQVQAVLEVSVDDSAGVTFAIHAQPEDLKRIHSPLDIYAVANESTLVRVPEEIAERIYNGELLMIASEQDGDPVLLLKNVRERIQQDPHPESADDLARIQ